MGGRIEVAIEVLGEVLGKSSENGAEFVGKLEEDHRKLVGSPEELLGKSRRRCGKVLGKS